MFKCTLDLHVFVFVTAGERVDETACDPTTKPSLMQNCVPSCGAYSSCIDGICRCSNSFQCK